VRGGSTAQQEGVADELEKEAKVRACQLDIEQLGLQPSQWLGALQAAHKGQYKLHY
jgi:hypothetical protein